MLAKKKKKVYLTKKTIQIAFTKENDQQTYGK